MAGRPNKRKVESVCRVAPIGLEFCGRSLRHRQVHEHIRSAWARTWTASEMIPHFLGRGLFGPARRRRL